MKKYFCLYLLVLLMSSQISFAQEITIFPGFWDMQYYENSNRITTKEVGEKMKNIPMANELWHKSKQQNTIGWLALIPQFGFGIWAINRAANGENAMPQLIGSLASGAVGIGFSLAYINSRKNAILTYNEKIKLKNETSLHLGSTQNGLGLTLGF